MSFVAGGPGCGAPQAPTFEPRAPAQQPERAQPAAPAEAPSARVAIQRAVLAADRSEADRALDEGRHPRELLEFFQLEPGWRVAELAAGGGYTAELVARVVGPKGVVYGQNSPFLLARFAEKPWSERLGLAVMKNVVRVDSEFDSPLPPEAKALDAVLMILFYHDMVWMKTDRAKMNESIFRALRPGGVYGIADHSARAGAGLADVETLHRIEKSMVVAEVERAGFVLEAEADFLQNPEDTRDWSASPRTAGEKRGTSDRFVLRFRKPETVSCSEPRPDSCSEALEPVCADVDTGVRCIRAPCPSSELKTFSNACQACREPAVRSFRRGACPER